jgi:hypothetical protein
MNLRFLFLISLLPTLLFSQFGPGGVGNLSDNGLWLKADDLTGLLNNDPVVTWFDCSGNNNDATNHVPGEQPVYNASSAINSRPTVYFDGVLDQMIIADDPILDGSTGITFYTVIRPDNLDGAPRGILGKRVNQHISTNYAYTFYLHTSNLLYLDIDEQNNRFSSTPSTFANGINYMLGFDFDGSRAGSVRSRLYNAGLIMRQATETSTVVPASNQDLILGGLNYNYSGQRRLGADYAEIVHFNRSLNSAERKIVENYLGAKYTIPVANPYYDHLGYPGEVAGIGRDDDTNFHADAQGTAIVRINNPTSLDDGDYLLWGHDEVSSALNNTIDVDGSVIEVRLERVWAATETGDVGNTDISFDISGFSPMLPSDLRLLIDGNNNGFADNDVTPISGIVSGSTITFSAVNLQNGDKFTLGSRNYNQTPLPVELTSFYLNPKERNVEVLWTTASELNADYYLVSKSKKGKSFETFAQVNANGTTSSLSEYKKVDASPYNGISYYQLTQVDFDGKSTNYGPISVNRVQDQVYALVPNPTNGAFKLSSAVTVEDNLSIKVYSSVGNLIKVMIVTPGEVNTKTIDLRLISGAYFVKINQADGFHTSLKLIVK